MRLVCPSCRAEYEVDVTLLPTEGREVQCSACHFIWFQSHPDQATPAAAQPSPAQPSPVPAPHAPAPHAPAAPSPSAQAEPVARARDDRQAAVAHDTVRPAHDLAAADAAQSPRTVSGQALDILREEADFEARQRAREAEGLETQPELGLANPAPWPSKTPRDAREQDLTAQDAQPPHGKAPLAPFPDIDDISTTLEPLGTSRRHKAEWDLPDTVTQKRRSFLKGLALPLVLAAVALVPYLFAPMIIDAVPAIEAALTTYVAAIDGLRVRLSAMLGG